MSRFILVVEFESRRDRVRFLVCRRMEDIRALGGALIGGLTSAPVYEVVEIHLLAKQAEIRVSELNKGRKPI